ncbi:hypothetical protein F5Y16DRAFT_400182 [Xylariaceae sp. FL0255]|nr:hypothetical protein F5Y16DRAFT_400182 [Xylariaceae sp. FL0255]
MDLDEISDSDAYDSSSSLSRPSTQSRNAESPPPFIPAHSYQPNPQNPRHIAVPSRRLGPRHPNRVEYLIPEHEDYDDDDDDDDDDMSTVGGSESISGLDSPESPDSLGGGYFDNGDGESDDHFLGDDFGDLEDLEDPDDPEYFDLEDDDDYDPPGEFQFQDGGEDFALGDGDEFEEEELFVPENNLQLFARDREAEELLIQQIAGYQPRHQYNQPAPVPNLPHLDIFDLEDDDFMDAVENWDRLLRPQPLPNEPLPDLNPVGHRASRAARRGSIAARRQANEAAARRRARDHLVGIELEMASQEGAGQRNGARPMPDIIDLTVDDDDDDENIGGGGNAAGGRPMRSAAQEQSHNLRRRHSHHQQSAPRLNRSDANYVGEEHQIIVLSDSESDEGTPPPGGANTHAAGNHNNRDRGDGRNHHYHHHHHHHHFDRHGRFHHPQNHNNHAGGRGVRNARFAGAARPPPPPQQNPRQNLRERPVDNQPRMRRYLDHLPFFQFLNPRQNDMAERGPPAEDDLVILHERNLGHRNQEQPNQGQQQNMAPGLFGIVGAPNIPNIDLNYNHHPFGLQIPRHGMFAGVAPGAGGAVNHKPPHVAPPPARPGFTRDTGEDVVAICPSCDQELAYDPDEHDDPSTPSKKRVSKTALREHHFWAVKACGHVYCKRCFDNRSKKTTSKNMVPLGFNVYSDKPKKVFCAVDDCNSDVTGKPAWVGIFM